MSHATHHIPDHVMASYAAGTLPPAFALVVAAHISMCDDCRADFEAHQCVGGAVLDTVQSQSLSSDLKSNLFAQLDEAPTLAPSYERSGIYPAPIMAALKGKPIRWKSLGLGVRQCILEAGPKGAARLLYIPAGQAVPDHSHNGLELTLVLQGSFSDETGRFGVGDVEVADQDLEHTPIADAGPACICLAATDAPLRFNALIPRLMQPIFRI